MEDNFDVPQPPPIENKKEPKACFPVSKESIDVVTGELQSKYAGDMGKFVDAEEEEIAKDEKLKEFVDKAFGWFEGRGNGDRAAFLDGAGFIHRVLRQQGDVPKIEEDPSDALEREVDAYQQRADKNNQTINEALLYADKSAFSHIPEPLNNTLTSMTENHPVKPSFAVGAEMMYSVLNNADLEALISSQGPSSLDDEIADFLGE